MKLKKGLIVSCQATKEEPFHGDDYMATMALAAEIGGAVGVRVNTISNIIAVKNKVDIPVVGLVKEEYEGYYPYISPTMKEVDDLITAGTDVIAIDGTRYDRPDGNTLEQFIQQIREKYDVEIMADVSTVAEGVYVDSLGVDYIATTLSGYTPDTIDKNSSLIVELRDPDLDLVRELSRVVSTPIVAEGRFWDEKNALKALENGAHCVTIGAGITRPQIITKKIVDKLNIYLGENDEKNT